MIARPIHFQVAYVKPNGSGGGSIAASSRYIRRCAEMQKRERLPLEGTRGYVTRAEKSFEGEQNDVAESRFFCRGSQDSARVWAAVDAAFRTKSGEYSRRGGEPRMALFIDATLPRELSEEQKISVGCEWAEAMVARYGVCVEAAWHVKDGLIDHVHYLVSTRVVDEDGVGPIVREFNGIASKCGATPVMDGKKRLAGHMEMMRSTFASILTRETGELYDPRSNERQNNGIVPVTYVSRARIEEEKRHGVELWREERRAHMAARQLFAGDVAFRIELSDEEKGRDTGVELASAVGSDHSETMPPKVPTSASSGRTQQPSSVPPSHLLGSLAGSPTNYAKQVTQATTPSKSPLRKANSEDDYVEMIRRVDELNRREFSQDMARQRAKDDSDAQRTKPISNLAGWLPPPLPANSMVPFGTSKTRNNAARSAMAKDRLASDSGKRDLAVPLPAIKPSDNASCSEDKTASVDVHRLAPEGAKKPRVQENQQTPARPTDPAGYAAARVRRRIGIASVSPPPTRSEQASVEDEARPLPAPRGDAAQPVLASVLRAGDGTRPSLEGRERYKRPIEPAAVDTYVDDHKPNLALQDPVARPAFNPHDYAFAASSEQRRLLIRLAALLQVSEGGLEVHRRRLAELAGMDLETFAMKVAIQWAAYAARGMPTLGKSKRILAAEIEGNDLSAQVVAALKALSPQSKKVGAIAIVAHRSRTEGSGIGDD